MDASRIRFTVDVPGGWNWSHVLKRGSALRVTDLEGRANVATLFYNAELTCERFNMPDTLKAQHTAFLTTGCVCYSDHGRVLVSLTADDAGWHDVLCGVGDAALFREKYGERRYQEARNAYVRNGRDGLLVELAKWGLGRRDMVANVNFFSKVVPDEQGSLSFVPGHSRPGASVDLRAGLNTLVVIDTCPHPLDPRADYAPGPVRLTVYDADPPGADDPCRTRCPENGRGFTNTERYFL
jgi:urea carboxylase-associated protein 2